MLDIDPLHYLVKEWDFGRRLRFTERYQSEGVEELSVRAALVLNRNRLCNCRAMDWVCLFEAAVQLWPDVEFRFRWRQTLSETQSNTTELWIWYMAHMFLIQYTSVKILHLDKNLLDVDRRWTAWSCNNLEAVCVYIFVFHDGHHGRLNIHGAIHSYHVLVGRLITLPTWPWPIIVYCMSLHVVRVKCGGGSRNGQAQLQEERQGTHQRN